MEKEISLKINKCLEEFGISTNAVTDTTHLTKDLGLDSLDVTDLILNIESAFHCQIPDNDWHLLQTVGQLKNYMSNLLVVAV